jgi:hypothetical protein
VTANAEVEVAPEGVKSASLTNLGVGAPVDQLMVCAVTPDAEALVTFPIARTKLTNIAIATRIEIEKLLNFSTVPPVIRFDYIKTLAFLADS